MLDVDEWMYSSVKGLVTRSKPVTESIIDIENNIFVTTMQKMVGSGLRAAKNHYCPTKSNADPAFVLVY